jgi:hypothetical protein
MYIMNSKIIFGGVLLSIIIIGLFIKRENLEGFSSCKIGCKAPTKQTGNCTYPKLADGTFDKTKILCPWNCENKNPGNEDSTQCMYDSDCAGCLPTSLFNNIIGSTGTIGNTFLPGTNNLGNTGSVNSIDSNTGNTGPIYSNISNNTAPINTSATTSSSTSTFDSDLYMLKSSYVPPICPAYPTPYFHKKKKHNKHSRSNKNNTKYCVNQTNFSSRNIPLPVLPDFTTYGM